MGRSRAAGANNKKSGSGARGECVRKGGGDGLSRGCVDAGAGFVLVVKVPRFFFQECGSWSVFVVFIVRLGCIFYLVGSLMINNQESARPLGDALR